MRIVTFSAQSGLEWLLWRNQGIGASDIGSILGLNPWKGRAELLEEKVLGVTPQGNEHTERGHTLEPKARKLYEELYGYRMNPVCGEHDNYPWLRASFDGMNDERTLILELKAPSLKYHRETLEYGIPDWYKAQVQHQLLVSGAHRAHFISYCESKVLKPYERFKLIPVEPDTEFHAIILDEGLKFWNEVQSMKGKS